MNFSEEETTEVTITASLGYNRRPTAASYSGNVTSNNQYRLDSDRYETSGSPKAGGPEGEIRRVLPPTPSLVREKGQEVIDDRLDEGGYDNL